MVGPSIEPGFKDWKFETLHLRYSMRAAELQEQLHEYDSLFNVSRSPLKKWKSHWSAILCYGFMLVICKSCLWCCASASVGSRGRPCVWMSFEVKVRINIGYWWRLCIGVWGAVERVTPHLNVTLGTSTRWPLHLNPCFPWQSSWFLWLRVFFLANILAFCRTTLGMKDNVF